MTREDLVRQLSEKLDTPEHSSSVFLHAFFDVTKSALRSGESVQLEQLGLWEPVFDEEHRLTSISFFPARDSSQISDEPTGPVSSIDARHFIPAEALETPSSAPAPIDIEVIVSEVNKLFHDQAAEGGATGETRPQDIDIPDVDEFQEVLRDETPPPPKWTYETALLTDDDVEVDPASIEDDDSSEEGYGPDDSLPEIPMLEEIPDEEPEPGYESEDADLEDGYADDAVVVEDTEGSAPDDDSEETELVVTEEDHAGDVQEGDLDDDSEEFYRNRDQLYNPPKEGSSKRLLLIAVILTACVIAIVLFLMLGGDDRPPLPTDPEAQMMELNARGQAWLVPMNSEEQS